MASRLSFAADAERFERHAGHAHFGGGRAAAGDAVLHDLRRIGAAHQAGEKCLGAGHPRRRDDVQHARWAGMSNWQDARFMDRRQSR